MKLSIVIPVYNEEDSLPALAQSLSSFLSTIVVTYEVILVDDGSRDRSREVLQELFGATPGFRLAFLRTNRGQTAAMAAGLELARGEVIVFMDADLQNDPSDIPRLIAKLDEGYDLVSGWRRQRQDAAFTRTLPSRIANRLIGWVTGVRIHDYGCTLKAYRTEIVKSLHLYSDMHRFLPALCSRLGARITEIEVKHHPRRHGTSKYGLNRIFKVLADLIVIKLIVNFADRPMHYFGILSVLFLAPAGTCLGFWLQNLRVGWREASVILPSLVVLFLSSSLYFLCLGLLSDLILRVRNRALIEARRHLAMEFP